VYYVWLKAVDTSGNKSAFTTSVSGTPSGIITTDLNDSIITTSKVTPNAVSTISHASYSGNQSSIINPWTYLNTNFIHTTSGGVDLDGGGARSDEPVVNEFTISAADNDGSPISIMFNGLISVTNLSATFNRDLKFRLYVDTGSSITPSNANFHSQQKYATMGVSGSSTGTATGAFAIVFICSGLTPNVDYSFALTFCVTSSSSWDTSVGYYKSSFGSLGDIRRIVTQLKR